MEAGADRRSAGVGRLGGKVQIFRRGLPDVARRILDGRGPLPIETEQKIQIGLEARALRYWEYFDEGIYRWRHCTAITTPTAGNRKGLIIQGIGGGTNDVPRGTWWSVEGCRNCLAVGVGQGIDVWLGGGVQNGVVEVVSSLDRRFSQSNHNMPLISAVLGDGTIAGAKLIGQGAIGYQDIIPIDYVGMSFPEADPAFDNVLIRGLTVDVSFQVEVWGKLYLGER